MSSELPKSTGAPAHQNVTFPSAGDTAHGYLALPPSGSGPGVIVIQ
jgi:carboxymethylenebutenolidase